MYLQPHFYYYVLCHVSHAIRTFLPSWVSIPTKTKLENVRHVSKEDFYYPKNETHLSCAVSVGWTSSIKHHICHGPFPCRWGHRSTQILPSFTTEAVLCKCNEPSAILLQCCQELRILKFELVLEAIAKISDNVYVIFHFLLDRIFFSSLPSSLSINQPIIVVNCICSQFQPIVNWIVLISIHCLWAVWL